MCEKFGKRIGKSFLEIKGYFMTKNLEEDIAYIKMSIERIEKILTTNKKLLAYEKTAFRKYVEECRMKLKRIKDGK